jgi:hypothetical protein
MLRNIITKPIGIIAMIFTMTGLLPAQDILWQRIFDTGETDYAEDITTDYQGNIIVVGSVVGFVMTTNDDILIIKYSPSGDTLWTKRFDLTWADVAYGVAADPGGNIIVVGGINDDLTGWNTLILKCDSDGNLLWKRTYSKNDEGGGISGVGVVIDSENNLIVIGKVADNWGDYITLKYDPNGNLLWFRTYDGDWEDRGRDVSVDDSDNIIVTGYSNGDMNWDWCTIKYSPEGDTLWIRRYDVAATDWAFGVATDQDDNVIVVGETHQLLPGTGGKSGMVVKYSPEGDTLWTKIFTDTLQQAEVGTFADATADDQGNIYLAGEYAWWNDKGQLWKGYYIVKCASSGDTVWTKHCSYGGRNEPSGIALDQWGNIIVTGSTYPGPEESGQRDYFTVKLQNTANSVEEFPTVPKHFALYQNYPNPFNASTTLRYEIPTAARVKITLYDLLGRNVGVLANEYQRPGEYQTAWDAADFSSGVYFVRMTAGDYTACRKILLMK